MLIASLILFPVKAQHVEGSASQSDDAGGADVDVDAVVAVAVLTRCLISILMRWDEMMKKINRSDNK